MPTRTQTRTILSPTLMESTLPNPRSPGPSTYIGLGKSYTTSPPPRGNTNTPRHLPPHIINTQTLSESFGPNSTGLPIRPRDEIRDLTEGERYRLEWDILLRKKDKYKTWKKRIKEEWRELEDAKMLMEANRQQLREDEVVIREEKRVVKEQWDKLKEQQAAFKTVELDTEEKAMRVEEDRRILEQDRQKWSDDVQRFHKAREEWEEERTRHAEETVRMRAEWEEMRMKHQDEEQRLEDMRRHFEDELREYEKERRIFIAVRDILEE